MSATPVAEAPPAAAPAVKKRRSVKEQMSSKGWQLTTIILPILLTTWLTYFVSQKQSKTEDRINTESQLLQQQLQQQMQLSEELFKRRFDAYDNLYVQLVQHQEKLRVTPGAASLAEWNKANADQAIQINELLNLSRLHLSKDVESITRTGWPAVAAADPNGLSDFIDNLTRQMKKEVDEEMLAKQFAMAADSAQTGRKKKTLPVIGGTQ